MPELPDPPVPRATLVQRLQMRASGWVTWLLGPLDVPSSIGGAWGVRQVYQPIKSMSAVAAFPWVRTCAQALVDDQAGLPLVVTVGRDQADQLASHPFLDLIERPAPGVTETVLRRQLHLDYEMTGNAYLWLRDTGSGWELHRLHPQHVSAHLADGRVAYWVYRGSARLSPLEVFHIRDVSWSDQPDALFGESKIRTLEDTLLALRAARKHAAKAAERGRPDGVFSFPDGSSVGADALDEIVNKYEKQMRLGKPAIAVGGGAAFTPTTWEPKALQLAELDVIGRDETIAVMGVPPSRAGIPQANYATAKIEGRQYWQTRTLVLRLFDEVYTSIARRLGDRVDVRVRHDLSGVEALQASYDQRQTRVTIWHSLGATPAAAAAYEGFRDAPVGAVARTDKPAARPAREVDDQPSRQSILVGITTAYLLGAAERLQGGGGDVAAETWRLAGVLEVAGAEPVAAREVAAHTAELLVETAASTDRDLADLFMFSGRYAEHLVERLRHPALAAT